jgi:hypothetical protein
MRLSNKTWPKKALVVAQSITIAASAAFIGLSADDASAQMARRRWDNDIQRTRQGQVIDVGNLTIGDGRRGESQSTIDLSGHPMIQCNLSHLMFTAYNDSVWLTRAYVEYARPNARGEMFDWIDLDVQSPPPMPPGRHRPGRPAPPAPTGLQLAAGQASPWLDVDDVLDGSPSGRCIRRITVFGIDTPDMPGPGRFERHDPPALVRVNGFVVRRGPPAPPPGHGGGRPGHGGGIGPGPGHNPGPAPILTRPPRAMQWAPFGNTGGFSRSGYETREIPVGAHRGRFDGVRLTGKRSNTVKVDWARVHFANGDYVEIRGFELSRNQEVYLDFDGPHRRGGRDQDRHIVKIVIRGHSELPSPFDRGEIEISGGR